MIRNRNMAPDAVVRHTNPVTIDISSATAQAQTVFFDNLRDAKIVNIFFHYSTATNGGTMQDIHVGTPADDNLYLDTEPTASTSAGTTETKVPLVSTLLSAGTGLIVQAEAASATNTGVVEVSVAYELVDRNIQ